MTDSRLSRRLLATPAFLLAAPLAAQPAEPSAPSVAEDAADDPIIVTAARTILPASALPLTVDVIGPEDLDQQVAIGGSIVEAVSALSPSFSPTRQKLTGAGETLRGRSPLYAIDGIPQSTPVRDGSRDGFTIDPFFVDRVELIYGSNALQGIGATGGVVNQVIVAPPREDGVSGRAMLQATTGDEFSDEGFGWKAAGLASWRGGAIDVTAGGAYERRGVFRDGRGRIIGPDGAQGEIQDSESWSAFGRIGLALGDSGRLELTANRFELEGDNDYVAVPGNPATGRPTTGIPGLTPGRAPSNRVETVSLSYTDDDLFGGNLIAQLFYNRTRDIFGGGTFGVFQDPAIAPPGTLFDQSANRSRKLGSRFSYERAIIADLTATIGFDTLFDRTGQSLVLTGRSWVPEVDFRSLAPFAQLNLALFDDVLRLAGGARWENVRTGIDDFTTLAAYGAQAVEGGAPRFDDVLLNGGVIVEPVPGIRAYASYAEGYTLADIGRILRGIDRPGVDVDSFLDLTPVVSNNREIGVEVARGPLTASATYFWSSSDLGSRLELVGGAYVVRREATEIEGFELNLVTQTPVPGFDLSLGYAHLTGRSDTDGDDIPDTDLDGANISPDRLNLAAIYRSGPFSARAQANWYLHRSFDGRPVAEDFSGYAVVDAVARYRTAHGTATFAVGNLFDTQYLTYNAQTASAANAGRQFAGRGRTFTLGWEIDF